MSTSDTQRVHAAAALLREGRLVAFPTETVYGLGCDARNPRAVARVFEAKGRPADHPLIVHVGDAAELARWVRRVPAEATRLAEAFWPGPLTLILERAADVPAAVTGGQDTIGVRVPGHPLALALVRAFAGGVAAPSANRFGRVSPTTAADVRDELGDRVDCILDGGPCAVGLESTIVDLTGDVPAILRHGGVTREALEATLGRALDAEPVSAIRCSGRLPSHYAPRARVVLAAAAEVDATVRALLAGGRHTGVIAPGPIDAPSDAVRLPVPADPDGLAQVLYDRLRAADRLGLDAVVVVPPADEGIGRAIRDRLERAAAPRPTDDEPG